MSLKKWADELYASIENDPAYIAEGIALNFIVQCENRRAELGWSYAELARRMGVSRQHVNKLMTGTQNSTISSLVKLALVLEGELNLGITFKPAQKDKPSTDKAKHVKLLDAKTSRKPVSTKSGQRVKVDPSELPAPKKRIG